MDNRYTITFNTLENSILLDLINLVDESTQLCLLKKYIYLFKYIKNPSQKIQLYSIKMDYTNIHYIKNPTEDVQLKAIKYGDFFALAFISNPSEKVQLEVVKKYNFQSEHSFFQGYLYKINAHKALLHLYKKTNQNTHKKLIMEKINQLDSSTLILEAFNQ